MSKLKELREEFRSVFSGRGTRLLDSFFPLLVFLITNPLIGLNYAIWGSLVVAGLFAVYRIIQRESLVYSLGGLGGVLLASVFVKLSGYEAGFFLPGFISGAVTVVLCVVSVAINRPLVAWTSFITRRWPLEWYWHPKVLPAYNEVTIMWAVAFSARLALEYWFFQKEALSALGATRVFLGWPYTVILLIASYLYGLWRLGKLKGPSIEEFKTNVGPPWEGQKRGF
jgi:hypothetical protein